MAKRRRSWDRHSIMAEIRRRGSSLRSISTAAGLSRDAACKAFTQPFPAAEAAISDFLGVSPSDLWPDRYPLPSSRGDHATDDAVAASQNDVAARTLHGVSRTPASRTIP